MKHKGWIRFLGLVLALLLPVSAMAQSAAMDLLEQANTDGKEIVTTITLEPGAMFASDQIVADLSAATAIRLNKLPGGYGAFAVVLSGVDVISAQMRMQPDGMYLQSETLGAKPLYVSWEDLNKLMTEAMKSSGQGNSDQFAQGFMNGFQRGLMTGSMFSATDAEKETLTEAEIKQKMIEAMDGDDSFVKWLEAIESKKVVTKGEYQPTADSDPADTKTDLTVTAEDIANLYETSYIQKQIANQLKASDATLTDEQAAAKTVETVATIKEEVLKTGMTIPMTIYTKGEDEFVAMLMTMSGTFEDTKGTTVVYGTDASLQPTATESATPAAPETVKMSADVTLSKKTADKAKQYTAKLNVYKDDAITADMNFLLTYDDQKASGSMTVLDHGKQQTFTMLLAADYTDAKHTTGELDIILPGESASNAIAIGFEQTVADSTIDTSLSLSTGATLDAIKANPDQARMGMLKVSTVIAENSGLFSSLSEATPATSIEIAKYSDTQMQEYLATLQTNAMQTFYKVMGNLPQSVSSAIGGMMGN